MLNLKQARPDEDGMVLAPKGNWTAPTEDFADQGGSELATQWVDVL